MDHQCVPDEVADLAEQERLADAVLASSSKSLILRKSLSMVTGEYIPAAQLEAAAMSATRQRKELRDKVVQLLRRQCDCCPKGATCPARMT